MTAYLTKEQELEARIERLETTVNKSNFSAGLVDLVIGLDLTALNLHEKNVERPDLGKVYSWNLRANILGDIAKAIECAIKKGN